MNLEQETQRISGCLAQRRVPDDIARQMHIEQYSIASAINWSNQRRDAISDLSHRTGISELDLSQHTFAEHNLIDELLRVGNKEEAVRIAHDPSLLRSQRPDLLVKMMAWRFFDDHKIRKHERVSPKDIEESLSIKNPTAWKEAFDAELRELKLSADSK